MDGSLGAEGPVPSSRSRADRGTRAALALAIRHLLGTGQGWARTRAHHQGRAVGSWRWSLLQHCWGRGYNPDD